MILVIHFLISICQIPLRIVPNLTLSNDSTNFVLCFVPVLEFHLFTSRDNKTSFVDLSMSPLRYVTEVKKWFVCFLYCQLKITQNDLYFLIETNLVKLKDYIAIKANLIPCVSIKTFEILFLLKNSLHQLIRITIYNYYPKKIIIQEEPVL